MEETNNGTTQRLETCAVFFLADQGKKNSYYIDRTNLQQIS